MRAKILVSDAGAKGMGAFAAAPMQAGSKIASMRGKVQWIWDIPEGFWPYAFQVDYDRYVVPKRGSAGWAINHSCEPNCIIHGASIVARRAIRTGEELTFDYSTDVDWSGFKMKCLCGESGCRRTVRAYRFLPAAVKSGYGDDVAPYIRRRYSAVGRRPAH